MHYTNLAIQSPDAKGGVLQIILCNAARIAFDNQEVDYSDKLEQQAKALLPELGTPPRTRLQLCHFSLDRTRQRPCR